MLMVYNSGICWKPYSIHDDHGCRFHVSKAKGLFFPLGSLRILQRKERSNFQTKLRAPLELEDARWSPEQCPPWRSEE